MSYTLTPAPHAEESVLYNNAKLSTILKTSIQRLFPQRGRILPVLSTPPAVQLSALGAHFDFLLHARSRAPLLPKPRRQDVSRCSRINPANTGSLFLVSLLLKLVLPTRVKNGGRSCEVAWWHQLGCDDAANVTNVQVTLDINKRSHWC